jgi:hypothetical protein
MSKRPRDANQLAKMIVDISTDEIEDKISDKKKSLSTIGRVGGLKGGTARAVKLTPEQRSDIARLAASARWKKSEN